MSETAPQVLSGSTATLALAKLHVERGFVDSRP